MTEQEPSPHAPPLRRFRDPAYVPLADNLAQVRERIDALDTQIVALMAERGRYVKDAARIQARCPPGLGTAAAAGGARQSKAACR